MWCWGMRAYVQWCISVVKILGKWCDRYGSGRRGMDRWQPGGVRACMHVSMIVGVNLFVCLFSSQILWNGRTGWIGQVVHK